MLQGIVYILTNKHNTTLYTGVTRDLRRRVAEHKLHINQGFTAKYNIEKLVYYEVFDRLDDGVHREKQLKKWHRDWKEKLINDFNPEWKDLAETIGVDTEYIQAVKSAYECGQYVPGDSVVSSPHFEASFPPHSEASFPPHSETFSSPHSGLDPDSHEIAGQARDEGKRAPR